MAREIDISDDGEITETPPDAIPSSEREEPKRKRGRKKKEISSAETPVNIISPDGAENLGRACAKLYALPFYAASKHWNDKRLIIEPEEQEAIAQTFKAYIMMRPEIVGEYLPEIMLAISLSAPVVARVMLPKKTWSDNLDDKKEEPINDNPTQ